MANTRPTQIQFIFPALLLLSSCTQTPRHLVIKLDVSRSVHISDTTLIATTMDLIGHLHRCDEISITPVNARAGSLISENGGPITIPCEEQPYDNDLKKFYKKIESMLTRSLQTWREHDMYSDYLNTFAFVAQLLRPASSRFLVVLGDMVHEGPGQTRYPKPPDVPSLGNLDLNSVNVYVGFIESSVIDRLSRETRERFQQNWTAALSKAGARVTMPPFGLQGVQPWAHEVLGEPNPAYVQWRKR